MWIKVTESSPSEDNKYLVFAPSAYKDKPFIHVARFDPTGFGWSLLPKVWIDAITHWMPLPEPPKSDNLEAVEQPLTGDNTPETPPKGEIKPSCGKCVAGWFCKFLYLSADCYSSYYCMSNLIRYDLEQPELDEGATMLECECGEYVKFDDIKEFLNTDVQHTIPGSEASTQIAAELTEAAGHICGGTYQQALNHINEAKRRLLVS